MIFDEFTLDIWNLLPYEIWLMIRSIYIRNFLKDHLKIPSVLPIRMNHELFADFWRAKQGNHIWEIETGNTSSSTLICQYFKESRVSLQWCGEYMLAYEQVFGIGFGISRSFLESIFPYADYLDLLTDSDEDFY